MENKKELKFFLNDEENSASTEAEDKKAHKSSHTHSHHSHHGHTSHHRHSSKKRSQQKNKKQKENFKNFIKRNKKYLIYLGITLLLILSLVIFGVYLDSIMSYSDGSEDEDSNDITEQTYSDLKISVPFFEDEVVIVGPAVVELMNADSSVEVKNIYNKYKSTSDRLDVGLPVKLKYNIDKIPEGYNVKSTEFLVSETSDFKSPLVFKTEGSKNYVDVYHLKTNTKYFYKLNITFNNGNENSVSGSFLTAAGPRVLTVNGVYNLRDIGGYQTDSNKTIKQGLLYRGCEIDGSIESEYKITAEGLNTMLSVFGIKTDMDLRSSSDNKYGTDALGNGVKHIYYGAPMYSNVFNDSVNREAIRKIFSDLADQGNYPVYLHCTYGVDRTGTVVYLLEGLLGMSDEDMLKDYKLSGLHHGDVSNEQMTDFINSINLLPGNSTKQKIEGYLLSIGVTVEEIESIRNIYLG